jgi:hypothetical protein
VLHFLWSTLDLIAMLPAWQIPVLVWWQRFSILQRIPLGMTGTLFGLLYPAGAEKFCLKYEQEKQPLIESTENLPK